MKNKIQIFLFILLVIYCKDKRSSQIEIEEVPKKDLKLTIEDFEGSWYEESNFEAESSRPSEYPHTEGALNTMVQGFKIWKDKRGFQFQIRVYDYDTYFPRSRYEIKGNEIRIFYKEPDSKKEIEAVNIRVLPEGKACILSFLTDYEGEAISYKCNTQFIKPNPDPLPGNWNSARHKKHYYTRTFPDGGIGGTSELDVDALDAVKEEEKE